VTSEFQPGRIFKRKNVTGHCLFLKQRISNVTVTFMYKHPNFPDRKFLRHLRSALEDVSGKEIFVGDININLQQPEGRRVLSLFMEFHFHSNLNIAQASTDGGTHIDCCFSNADEVEAWFYESYYSYHKPICIVWPKN
jgi:hypothetical protein